ncbi:uncharacterized protein N0V89_009489 [Didymosphaeria variabile]|uniref:Uncharacterized protein n=1 Tax=Didymosphaeria variabile TaxID=1932322 RepID=A0A9W9C6L6_9PLEO|nr:uncharacterized protein N0V89_009489 [Didymosphaeria variabile]KAJ4348117.1 hypothetical protein N0V89_009489 [Didymosphaeria variabile]
MFLRGDDLGSTTPDEHQTFRVLDDGSKLPLPPTLDPIVVAQKSRSKKEKEQPDVSKFTPFQKKLRENPYAHALASPVRIDRSLSTILPSDLLITLHLKPHATTGEPWLLPLGISSSKVLKHHGPPFRFLAHRQNVQYFTTKKDVWRKALTARHVSHLGTKGLRQLVWRKDMPALLLELLQKRVVDKLAWWYKWRGRLVPIPSPSPSDLDEVEEVSCVLFYGSLKTRADEIQAEVSAIVAEADKWSVYFRSGYGSYFDPHVKPKDGMAKATHNPPTWYEPLVPRLAARAQFPPLEFETTKWRGRKVALYSLTDMLGEERARHLVAGTEYEGDRCWVMKRARHNVPAELLLMQLQSYLAEPGPLWEPQKKILVESVSSPLGSQQNEKTPEKAPTKRSSKLDQFFEVVTERYSKL